jgi:pimeloyl-ACP methyl ester carboxylesterase
MKNKFFLLLFVTATLNVFSQEKKITETEITVNSLIKGTLFSPENATPKTKLVILIAGSGPTDRNGNQPGVQANEYKYLAQALAKEGIAVFSYDKRIIAQMANKTLDEKTLSFEDFIVDAKDVFTFFKAKKEYARIIIAGHSEGSLIGMVAANQNADAFISISGPGRGVDEVIAEQIGAQMPTLKEETQQNLALLKKGQTFELKNPALQFLFRESVQPYLISWIKYDPTSEVAKLKIPVLLINGTKDLQVKVMDAELLKQAKPDAKLVIIENMNHVLKEIKGDDSENMAAYNIPDLPVMVELVTAVNQFIKTI